MTLAVLSPLVTLNPGARCIAASLAAFTGFWVGLRLSSYAHARDALVPDPSIESQADVEGGHVRVSKFGFYASC